MENDSFPHDLWWFTYKKWWFPIATLNIHRIIGSMISYREMPKKKLDTNNEWIELGQKFSEAPGSECSDPNGLALMIQNDQTSEGAHGHPMNAIPWWILMVPWSCSVAFQSLVSTCFNRPSIPYDPHMIPIPIRQDTWDPFDPEVLGQFVPLLLGLKVHRQPITVVVLEVLLTQTRPWNMEIHEDTWRPPNPSMF